MCLYVSYVNVIATKCADQKRQTHCGLLVIKWHFLGFRGPPSSSHLLVFGNIFQHLRICTVDWPYELVSYTCIHILYFYNRTVRK